MGRKDVVTRQYLSSADVFADVVNLALYSGKRVVCATDLKEMDAAEEIAITLEKSNTEPKQRKQTRVVQKYRDIMREVQVDGEDGYLARIIVGVEEQSETHYAMPVRNMLYDALDYSNQVRRIGELNRREGITLSSAEFLSGIRKEDKLIPVVTIVVTFQPEAWDGPLNVHDMLDWKGIPSEIRTRIPNYEMLLLQPSDYDEEKVSNPQSTFGVIMGLLKYASSMKDFQEYVDRHEDVLSNMPSSAAAVLNEFCTLDMSEKKLEEDEVIDMCQAVREMKEVSRQEGRQEGRREGRQEGAIKVYYQRMNYTAEQIAEEMNMDVEDVEKIIETLDD